MPNQSEPVASNLNLRPGDQSLDVEELKQLSLIANLKNPNCTSKCLAGIVLRRYSQGDVICSQGDAGSTAFYILSADDVVSLRNYQFDNKNYTGQEQELFQQDVQEAENPAKRPARRREDNAARMATAVLLDNSANKPKPKGWFGGGSKPKADNPEYIPIDGPTDINYQSRTAPMFEKDIFGEMSCINYTPRSATIIADSDCFMLEFLRVFLEELRKDPNYREKMDDDYRQRVLKNHLKRADLLGELGEPELNMIRDSADLVVVEPGNVICDEGDPSDSVYLVRTGLVQVIADLKLMFVENDISNWRDFCKEVVDGGE